MAIYNEYCESNNFVTDFNIIRGINRARDISNKAIKTLAILKGSDSHVYNYDCYERLFDIERYIKTIDDSIMAIAQCSISLDANTAIFEMLDLIEQKDKLIQEYQIRVASFNKIPELDRYLLYLKFGKGLPVREIADITNISMRTILRRLKQYGISKFITNKEQLNNVITTIPSDFTIKCYKEAV